MDREQDETVLHITAQYAEEARVGQEPRLSDYLARYPQHAAAITNFVTYYHSVEADVPHLSAEDGRIPQLSEDFRIAIEYVTKRVGQSGTEAVGPNTSLLRTLNTERLPLRQLASTIGLSKDIVTKLDQRKIDPATLPGELFQLLERVLHQPIRTLQTYFGLPPRQQLAEAPAVYQVEEASKAATVQRQSFREAIEQSKELSAQQKYAWLYTLDEEGL